MAARRPAARAGVCGAGDAGTGLAVVAGDADQQIAMDLVVRAVERGLGRAGPGAGAPADRRPRLAGDRAQLRRQCNRRLRRFGVDGLRTGGHRRMERDLPPWLCLDGGRCRSAVAVAALRAGLRGDVVGRGALDGLARLDPEDLTAAVHCPITARRYARRMRATNTGRGRRTMRRPLTPAERDAVEAGLRYVSDTDPGIRRMRCGSGFRYLDPDGATLRDVETLARIRSLAIPPAYREVWICRSPRGHLQA